MEENKKIKSYVLHTMMLMSLSLLCGCMVPRIYSPPGQKIMAKGDKLYLNDQLYAELRCWGTIEREQSYSGGVAIFYYPENREEWIFPKQGLGYYIIEEDRLYSTTTEMKELERTAAEKGLRINGPRTGESVFDRKKMYILAGELKWEPYEKAAPFSRAYDIYFSENGKYVCFQVEGSQPNSRKYLVKYENCFKARK